MSSENKKGSATFTIILVVIAIIGFFLVQAYIWAEKHIAHIVFFGVVALILYLLYLFYNVFLEFLENRKYNKSLRLEKQKEEERHKELEYYRKLNIEAANRRVEILKRIEGIKNNRFSLVIQQNNDLISDIEIEKQKLSKNLSEMHYLMSALQNKKKDFLNTSDKEKFLWRN